jgi:glycyl-tRNA synthetase
MEDIVALCKRRGFIYPTSEIYGGLANSYDYGPLGAELLRNIRNLWWKEFISKRGDMVGLDSQIILHPETWVASGHVGSFSDPLVEDTISHQRYRADHVIEKWLQSQKDKEKFSKIVVEDMNIEEMGAFIAEHKIKSQNGNPLSEPKQFNQLFETQIGAVSGEKSKVYLRGETAQGIFTNFKNILDSNRLTLPFGVGQIGKSFRNEVTSGQFVFRTIELEQAEIEYFFDPEETNWETLFKQWQDAMWHFMTKIIGIKEENLRWRRHTDKERSFYSKDTYDLDYKFPFGWKELWGIAYRTDYDLNQHMKHSGKSLEYTNPFTGKKMVPHVIEPALGVGRTLFIAICDSYRQDPDRTYLALNPQIAPFKVAVFPLLANKEELVAKAKDIFTDLKQEVNAYWDARGNIGKRYKYQDEMGTPYCVTVDFQTLEDKTVTVRSRDSMTQERIPVEKVREFIKANVSL